jgi:pimeloyl-ACP methyl ester carboxylesterase
MIRFLTASDGAQIAFSDEGVGLPVLCLAGLTRTMGDFAYMAPHLPSCRLIRMDYRGRGASQWTGAASYTVPVEGRDALELLDHLGLERAAIIGTSRGGLIGMFLAAVAPDRFAGLCLNDIGPVIERAGLERIFDYLGRNPVAKTHAELAAKLPGASPGYQNVPASRWLEEAQLHYRTGGRGLEITYDPTLREAFIAAFNGPPADLWPLFDALAGKPLALIRGENSDLLTMEAVGQMQARRPDMVFANVPDRPHIPFLDEPESLSVIRAFLAQCEGANV